MASVLDIHALWLPGPEEQAGPLIDALGSAEDRLWPGHRWPPMRVAGGLKVGAEGGHGPVRYVVAAYEPGRRVTFRFTAPQGFCGSHSFSLRLDGGRTLLEHRLEMRTTGLSRFGWPLVFGPLHGALAKDAGVCARRAMGEVVPELRWSPYVRLLRRLLQWLS